jgi:hypothetical protein
MTEATCSKRLSNQYNFYKEEEHVMKKKIYFYLLTFLLIPLTTNAQVGAAAGSIGTGIAVSNVVKDIEQSTANLIDDLDNVVSARSFQLRLELMFLLNELENKSSKLVGKTFGELNKSQQLFFENTNKSIAEIERLMSEGMDDADMMITHAEQIVAQIPFTENEPRLRTFSPLYVKSLDDTEPLKISIKGSFLNHGEAKLEVAGQFCDMITQTDSSLDFICDSAPFAAFETVNYVKGNLIVEEEQGFWDNLLSGNKEYKQYAISVSVVPKLAGSYKILATVNTKDKKTQGREGKWGHVNPHCRSSKSSSTNFGPSGTGWLIDVNSITTRVTNSRKGSHSLQNVSENGFQVYAKARNKGNCVLGSKDSRGAREGVASWQEYNFTSGTAVQTLGSGDLEWGKDIAIDLPVNLRGFKVIVNQIDGNVSVVNTAEDKKWFAVSKDGGATSLILQPKTLKTALSD